MGSWGTGALENDNAVGVEFRFEECFGFEYTDAPAHSKINAKQVSAFLHTCNSPEEIIAAAQIFIQACAEIDNEAAHLMMAAAATLSDEELLSDWENPEDRKASLIELSTVINAYMRGEEVTLRENLGVIETILSKA